MSVLLETDAGDLVIDLLERRAPRVCENFVGLARAHYYTAAAFSRVVRGELVQCGDPTSDTGDGDGETCWSLAGVDASAPRSFDDEPSEHDDIFDRAGLVAMARRGGRRGTCASQFFITTAPARHLDGLHRIFGVVAEGGGSTLRALDALLVDEHQRPLRHCRVVRAHVLDAGALLERTPRVHRALAQRAVPVVERARVGARLEFADDARTERERAGGDARVAEEAEAARAARARAEVLEVLGDLPSADALVDDATLFVCKLNPLTNSDDLDVIFARFGRVVSADVVRDERTNESLGYAFIRFARRRDAERAHARMNDVLVDDRRIRVDFSQSVRGRHAMRAAGAAAAAPPSRAPLPAPPPPPPPPPTHRAPKRARDDDAARRRADKAAKKAKKAAKKAARRRVNA